MDDRNKTLQEVRNLFAMYLSEYIEEAENQEGSEYLQQMFPKLEDGSVDPKAVLLDVAVAIEAILESEVPPEEDDEGESCYRLCSRCGKLEELGPISEIARETGRMFTRKARWPIGPVWVSDEDPSWCDDCTQELAPNYPKTE